MESSRFRSHEIKNVIREALDHDGKLPSAHATAKGNGLKSLGKVLFVTGAFLGSFQMIMWAHWHVRDSEILFSFAIAYGTALYCLGQLAELGTLPRLFRLVRPIGWIVIGLTMVCVCHDPWKRWWGQDMIWPQGVLGMYVLAFVPSGLVIWKKRDWNVFPFVALLYGTAFYCSPLGSGKFGVVLANLVVITMAATEIRRGKKLDRAESTVCGYALLGWLFVSGLSSLYFRPLERWGLLVPIIAALFMSREKAAVWLENKWEGWSGKSRGLIVLAVLSTLFFGAMGFDELRYSYDTVLESGEKYRFEIDWLGEPKNAVADKHLGDVGFKLDGQKISFEVADELYDYKESPMYIALDMVDEEKMVKKISWTHEQPQSGISFQTRIYQVRPDEDESFVFFKFPFGDYYLREVPKSPAEQIYMEMSAAQRLNSWMEVSILDGQAVPVQLYLDGMQAEDFLRNTELNGWN